MNNIQKRFLLFLLGCIPARLALVIIAAILSLKTRKYLTIITLPIAIGFLWLYFTKSRLTGGEVFGSKIWWHKFRIVHGLLFLTFSILALLSIKYSWIILLVDVFLGLLLFLLLS